MPNLTYPFVYECDGCGRSAVMTREDAGKISPNPETPAAADLVLEEVHQWVKDRSGVLCQECKSGSR